MQQLGEEEDTKISAEQQQKEQDEAAGGSGRRRSPRLTAKRVAEAEAEAKAEESSDEDGEAALPAGEASPAWMPLVNWPLWREEVLSRLDAVELMRLGLVSKLYRTLHSRDDLWLPLLKGPDEGYLAVLLTKYNILATIPPRLAYMRATTHWCTACNALTPSMNPFTVEPTCWDCFKAACREGKLMVKSQAAVHYLMNDEELEALPHVRTAKRGRRAIRGQTIEAAILFWRPQVEAAAIARYKDGLAGLEADRAKRKKKAKADRAKVLANYKELKKKAEAKGESAPEHPKPSHRMVSRKICMDSMTYLDNNYRPIPDFNDIGFAFTWAGLCDKRDASKPSPPQQLGGMQLPYCIRCHYESQYENEWLPPHAADCRNGPWWWYVDHEYFA